MTTTINGHSVEFFDMKDGRGGFYGVRIDGLQIGCYPDFPAAEKRAHAVCEHYPSADFNSPRFKAQIEILAGAIGIATDTQWQRDMRQQELGKLGALAIPPAGHSCPACNYSGTLYCSNVAAERLRGLR